MINNMNKIVTTSAFCLTFFTSAIFAASTDQVIDAEKKRISAAQQSQKKIDNIADKTDSLIGKLRTESKIVDGLKVYNQQLQKQIEAQNKAAEQLQESIKNVAIVERQIVPLTLKMIESLEAFVALDMPFSLVERRERIANLKGYMNDASVSAAERFRKVLEAYEIENEYGRTIEAYSDKLNLDGQALEVDILRVGRVGLYYQTKDGKKSGAWDKNTKNWTALDSGNNRHIRKAIRVANKQTAPELLKLPVHAPEKQ